MEEKEKNILNELNMSNRAKQIKSIYSGNDAGLASIFDKSTSASGSGTYDEDSIDEILDQVGNTSLSKKSFIKIANFAYATDSNYANIIDYLANMFLWRYYFVPIQKKEGKTEEDYKKSYDLMTEVVEGMSIEVTFPAILTRLIKEGSVFLYTSKDNISQTVSTIILNPYYCKPIMMTQYGTGIYQFDLSYFSDLGFSAIELDEVLKHFPAEISKAYKLYKEGGPKKKILDGRYSTYISLNDYDFPTHFSTIKSLFDFNQYRANEVERSSTSLDRIITHKIPSYENRLLFELPEVKALHKSMSKSLRSSSRTKFITSFGDMQIHPLLAESKYSSEMLEKGQQNIYRSAGINNYLFTGEIEKSLEISLTKDQAIMWKYIQQLVNFYNLTINNLFNFKGFQVDISMLPITHYNLDTMMKLYRENGSYGIGKLETIVASGTKQKQLEPKQRLEKFLKLNDILIPLQSAHTQSSTSTSTDSSSNEDEDIKSKNDIDDEKNTNVKSKITEV